MRQGTGGALDALPAAAGAVHLAPGRRGGGHGRAESPGGAAAAPRCALPGWRRRAFQLLLLAALWIATRPYAGVVHDGGLYMVQALRALQPGRFASDLYFAFGSQDASSAFSTLYAPLVGSVGPSAAHLVATAVGHVCWLVALLCLARGMFGGRAAVLAAAAAIALNPYCGDPDIFSYGEPFATPRLFAESGVMAALGSALRGRAVAAALCLLAAAAVHPLMALPGMAVVAVLLALRERRFWFVYGASAAGAAALAMAPASNPSRARWRRSTTLGSKPSSSAAASPSSPVGRGAASSTPLRRSQPSSWRGASRPQRSGGSSGSSARWPLPAPPPRSSAATRRGTSSR